MSGMLGARLLSPKEALINRAQAAAIGSCLSLLIIECRLCLYLLPYRENIEEFNAMRMVRRPLPLPKQAY